MAPAPSGIVTLTTDFGLDDGYVAQLHGVLRSRDPALRVVDVSHAVPPGSLPTTLFLTETVWPHFPPGTVHVVIVDPGVGGERGIVAVERPAREAGGWLVGPDTGVLSSGLAAASRPTAGVERVALPAGYAAAEIRETPLARRPVSRTFHGRDLMAPVAAALAGGQPLSSVGRPATTLMAAAALASPVREGAGEGRILHVDRFGNAITSFRSAAASARFVIEVEGRTVAGPVSSYGAGGEGPAALASSSGYIEIALADGSAAAALGIEAGTPVRLRPSEA